MTKTQNAQFFAVVYTHQSGRPNWYDVRTTEPVDQNAVIVYRGGDEKEAWDAIKASVYRDRDGWEQWGDPCEPFEVSDGWRSEVERELSEEEQISWEGNYQNSR